MTNTLSTIQLDMLSTVTGGDDTATAADTSANTATAQLGVQVPIGKTGQSVNVGGNIATSNTNYTECLRTVAGMPGSTPAMVRSTCGLPGGGN